MDKPKLCEYCMMITYTKSVWYNGKYRTVCKRCHQLIKNNDIYKKGKGTNDVK